MKQEVDQLRYEGAMSHVHTRIITSVFDTDVAQFMSNDKLFRAAMAEIHQRIVAKVADIVEPQITEYLIQQVDIKQLVNEATLAQIRAALFPKEKTDAKTTTPTR